MRERRLARANGSEGGHGMTAARAIYLGALIVAGLFVVVGVLWFRAFDPDDYEWRSFQYFSPSSDLLQLFLECPEGYGGRSAEDAATLAYAEYANGIEAAGAIRASGQEITVSTIRQVGRSSEDLEHYITNDLKCRAHFEFGSK